MGQGGDVVPGGGEAAGENGTQAREEATAVVGSPPVYLREPACRLRGLGVLGLRELLQIGADAVDLELVPGVEHGAGRQVAQWLGELDATPRAGRRSDGVTPWQVPLVGLDAQRRVGRAVQQGDRS